MELQEVANALMKMDEKAEAPETPATPAPVTPAEPVTTTETPTTQETTPPPEADLTEPADETQDEEDPKVASIKASAVEFQRQLKAAEREQERWRKQANYWMQAFQTQAAPAPQPTPTPQPNQPPTPSPYPPKPVLANFNDYDEYVENLTDWKLQKREIDARKNIEQQVQSQQQQEVTNFINTRMAEGLKKYPDEFWSRADEVGNRITEDMRRIIFKSDNFSELVMHLGKNLTEVERIATLPDPDERAYELKTISRRLKTDAINLKPKEQTQPANVAKPGTPTTRPVFDEKKAYQKAVDSGSLRDWAKVIELRESTPRKL